LTVASMPSHSHSQGSHNHTFNVTTGNDTHSHGLPAVQGGEDGPAGLTYVGEYGSDSFQNGVNAYNDSHTHSVSGSTSGASPNTNNDGGGGSHENRPPYWALCYIMKS